VVVLLSASGRTWLPSAVGLEAGDGGAERNPIASECEPAEGEDHAIGPRPLRLWPPVRESDDLESVTGSDAPHRKRRAPAGAWTLASAKDAAVPRTLRRRTPGRALATSARGPRPLALAAMAVSAVLAAISAKMARRSRSNPV